jgi:glyoxylate/hydroxypyruvate reductase A
MWEFLLAIVLSELKNTRTYLKQQAQDAWKQQDYRTINDMTISILGLGKIGGYVAEKFAQIGFKVKGWSNSKKQISKVTSCHGENEFDLFLNNSNFLINLLPLTDQTKGILNKKTFQKLPKDSFLINVGRGEHLVEDDLINSLDNSKLSGAFLDVFLKEPLTKEHPFWKHAKIQITPHVASLTNVATSIEHITENYNRFLKKEKLLNVVSLKKGY